MIAPIEYERSERSTQRTAIAPGFVYAEQTDERRGNQALETARMLVGRHPVAAIAAATVIGLSLGLIVKRGVK